MVNNRNHNQSNVSVFFFNSSSIFRSQGGVGERGNRRRSKRRRRREKNSTPLSIKGKIDFRRRRRSKQKKGEMESRRDEGREKTVQSNVC